MNDFNEKLGAMFLLLIKGKVVHRYSINRLLFFTDIANLLNTGRTISNEPYSKLPFGPVPKEMAYVRESLILSEYLIEHCTEIACNKTFTYTVSDIVDFDKITALFSPDELNTINAVKEALVDQSATFLAEQSHKFEPWKGGVIDGKLVLDRVFKDQDLIRWMQLNKMAGENIHVPEAQAA